MSDIGVVYICRQKDPNWRERSYRFVTSWMINPPGIDHQLYVIFKEFDTGEDLNWAMDLFVPLRPIYILNYMDHNSFGGGCFQEACNHVNEPLLCTLVSTSEIMCKDWLWRLKRAYHLLPNPGLVGCTGSRDANMHIRDTAILVDREFYLFVSKQFDFTTSKDDYLEFEHGPNNLTIQALQLGKSIAVVEKDRTLAPHEWGFTTYRGNLENVLVHDRGARDYSDL